MALKDVPAVSHRAGKTEVEIKQDLTAIAAREAKKAGGYKVVGKTYTKIINSDGKIKYVETTKYHNDANDGEYSKGRVVCIMKGKKTQLGNIKFVPEEYR